LLVSHLLRNTADCDASSLIVFAVSQELGWPVKLVNVPQHVFVRWEEENIKINIDCGDSSRQAIRYNAVLLDKYGLTSI